MAELGCGNSFSNGPAKKNEFELTGMNMSSAGSSGSTQGKRLLDIDDDRKLCRLIKDYLTPMGYDTTCVHPGPEGLEKAGAESWAAVILDVMLPGMDGFEVLKQIRRQSDVPVLMLTS